MLKVRTRQTRSWSRIALYCAAIAGIALAMHGLWIPVKAQVAQVLLKRAWAKTQAGETDVKPWPWADMAPTFQLSIPKLDARFIVLGSASGEALAFGPGWMPSTPRPGAPGLSIIAAHRDTHFNVLKEIAIGNAIDVTASDGSKLRFEVSDTQIVDARRSGLVPNAGEAGLALVTCWPFDATQPGPLRFVVMARLVSEGMAGHPVNAYNKAG
ncbi:MAG: class GN sortase [Pseudomonadota bacterium]